MDRWNMRFVAFVESQGCRYPQVQLYMIAVPEGQKVRMPPGRLLVTTGVYLEEHIPYCWRPQCLACKLSVCAALWSSRCDLNRFDQVRVSTTGSKKAATPSSKFSQGPFY
jgi:hypothetical protein